MNFTPHDVVKCNNLCAICAKTIANIHIQNIHIYNVVYELRSAYCIPDGFYSRNTHRSQPLKLRFEQQDDLSMTNLVAFHHAIGVRGKEY